MNTSVSRTIFAFVYCSVLSLISFAQTSTLVTQSAKKKLDPILQQTLIAKERFPEKKVTGVEYYAKGEVVAAKNSDVIGVLIQSSNTTNEIPDHVRSLGGTIGSRHGNIYTALIPVGSISSVAESPSVQYIEASKKLYQSLDLSLAKTGADVLHSIADPSKKLTGKGIIIGFTDSGINTYHPNFKTENGKTRILYIWDQYGFGTPPAGFTYGIEKDSAAINAGTYAMDDYGYHGTHVSGIAAGNGLPTKQYGGMAPEADIIMVANKGDDLFNRGLTTVGTLDGYDYIRSKANALGRRHVINTSQGTNLGPHDGTTLFEQAMNADAAAGTIFCLAAGNEGTSNRHASAVVTTASAKEIETYISASSGMTVPMDIWYNTNDRLTLQIKRSFDVSYVATFPAVDSTIIYNFGDVQVSVTTKIGSPLNGDNEIYIEFIPLTSISMNMKLKFSVEPGNTLPDGGRVDVWWERNYSVYFMTNIDQTMTFGIPAGCDSAITVASYNNRSGNGMADDISTFSGRGPRRDGKMKPDIAGLGGYVISSVSSSGYTSFSGTSMSSPHVAGAVALLLQQDNSLTGYQIKEKLKASAIADGFTGAVPNGTWGYGKMNVLKAAGYKGFVLTNLTPDSVLFGSVFVNTQKNQSVTIKNLGYESVTITSMTPSNAAITVNKSSFTIPARSENSFTVSVLPTDTGSFSGYVEIASNDTSSPSIKLPVLGRGDYKPAATITPDSLSFVVNEGDSTDAIVTISNSGQGPLTYKIEADYQVQSSSLQMNLQQKAYNQSWGSEFNHKTTSNAASIIVPNLPLLPLVIKDPVDDASGIDVIEVRGESKKDSLFIQFVTATTLDPYNFRGIVGLDIDQNQATGIKLPYGLKSHDVGCDFYLYIYDLYYSSSITLYDSSGYSIGYYGALVDTAGKRFTIALPLNKLKNDDGIVNIAAVVGNYNFSTDYVPNEGHGTVGLQWLVVNPKEGVVAPSGSQQITVRVRTKDLDGGKFKANVAIATNDPDNLLKNIPVNLTVVGNPNLVVVDSIKYPKVYLGFPDTMDVILGNNGTDDLQISNIIVSDPQLSIAGSTSVTVPKNKTVTVQLVFNPAATGAFAGSITIESNDPGSPSVPVAVTATVVHPPVMSVTPDSLSFIAYEKDSASAALTISNSGAGTLYWSINELSSEAGSFTLPAVNITAQNPDKATSEATKIISQSIAGIFGDLTGRRIGITNIGGQYAVIANDLASRGASVSPLYYPIAAAMLDTLDMIAIDDVISSFSASDISLLRDWVKAGHGILVQGDNSSSMTNINALLAETNITEISLGGFTEGLFTNITPHAVTEGVDSVFSNAYGSYCETTEPAIVVVRDNNSKGHVVVSRLSAGRVVVACNEIIGEFNFQYGDARVLSNRIFDWLSGTSDFLSVEPESGTIAPSASQQVTVKANAGSVPPGLYETAIVLHNNDPLQHPKNVPVRFHVKGRPAIIVEPESLAYPNSFAGIVHHDTLIVKNGGSDELSVTDIVCNDTIFHFDKKIFAVEPHSEEKVAISFTPHDTGSFSVTISITSNDSGRLTLQIPVTGHAAYPPVIAITPDSIIVSVDEGDSTTQTLTIGNTGKGDLYFTLTRGGYLNPLNVAMVNFGKQKSEFASQDKPNNRTVVQPVQQRVSDTIAGKKVLLIENSLPWGSNANEQILAANNIPYDIINSTTINAVNLTLYHVVIVSSDQTTSFYNDIVANKNKIDSYVERGGVLEFHAAASGWAGGDASSVVLPGGVGIVSKSSTINLVTKPSHPLVKDIPILFTGNAASHSYLSNLPVGTNVIVVDTIAPNLIEYNYGAGKVVASGQTLEYGYVNGQSAGKILMNLIPYCLSLQGGDWLSFSPDSGKVSSNAASLIEVKFNSELLSPGDYLAGVQINSNDPLQNPKNVPVKLHVVGKPILELEPDSLTNLPLFAGFPKQDTLHVKNIGTEPLSISGITMSDTTIAVNKTSFTVAPSDEEKLILTVTAPDTGKFFGKITLTSNDAKKPSVDFLLNGTAVYPPVFSLSTDTLIFMVDQGDSAEQKITLNNNGLGKLEWKTAEISLIHSMVGETQKSHSSNESLKETATDNLNKQVIPAGSQKILFWTSDTIFSYEISNPTNAIKLNNPNAQFEVSNTQSSTVFASQLSTADVLIVPQQLSWWYLPTLGSTFAPVLKSFVESGHTMIVLGGFYSGSTMFLNGTELLDISVITSGSFNAVVHDNSSPLVKDVPSTFAAEYNSNSHTSVQGEKIVRESGTGYNLVTSRSIGDGFVVYMGMDFLNYNSSMAKILSNAASLTAKNNIMTLSPDQGTIPAGGSQDVNAKCLAKDATEGEYEYRIGLSSNDPVATTKNIVVKITVQAPYVKLDYPLNKGLNLISWGINKTDSTSELFSPIMNSVSSVIGYYGGEKSFYPSNTASATLKTVDHTHGYWVTMNDTATLHLEGRLAPSRSLIFMSPGYNLVSYLGRSDDTVRSAFASVLNNVEWIMSYSTQPLAFDPDIPAEFNTLKNIKRGGGYWVKLKAQDTLIYPSLSPTSAKPLLAKNETAMASPAHSREWINVWGKNIKISGQLVPSGTVITAVDNEGTVCGETTFFASGSFGMMPIFKDDSSTAVDEGVKPGEFITFFIGGVEMNKKMQWNNFGDVVDYYRFLLSVPGEGLIPKVFALHQNFPNPFNPTTTLRYDIPQQSPVRITIYNILGEDVGTLVSENQSPGFYTVVWNGQTRFGAAATGVYFASIHAGDFRKTIKMVLLK